MKDCALSLCCEQKSVTNCVNCLRRELFEEKIKTDAIMEHYGENNDNNNN